jgi:hypothetical protein
MKFKFVFREPWSEISQKFKKKLWRNATSFFTDRTILQEETNNKTFVIDAKYV